MNADELVKTLDRALSDWEFHDVRLRTGRKTAMLRLRRSDFIRAVLSQLGKMKPGDVAAALPWDRGGGP